MVDIQQNQIVMSHKRKSLNHAPSYVLSSDLLMFYAEYIMM
jgi:hypothetical protein